MYNAPITITGDVDNDGIERDSGELKLSSVMDLDTVQITLNDGGEVADRRCAHCSDELDNDDPTRVLDGGPFADFCGANPDADTHVPEVVPLTWAQNITVNLDEEDDAINVWIATADPRGGFQFRIRRMEDGTKLLHVPFPGMAEPHEELTELHTGTYQIG